MPDESAIHVNFAKPIALFPLEGVSLYPHQVVPLHIFEPRYRQMLSDALDSSGLIAMAIYDRDDTPGESSSLPASPPLRRAVCLGTILKHERLPDGRFNVLMQGVCRARIIREPAREPGKLYRTAYLEPLEDPALLGSISSPLHNQVEAARAELGQMLAEGELRRLIAAEPLLEYIRNEDVSTAAVLELVASVLARDPSLRYELLAQPNAGVRAATLLQDLHALERTIRLAVAQKPERWPKGMSWN